MKLSPFAVISFFFFGSVAIADPILSGKTVMGCEADLIQVGEPSAPQTLANDFPVPESCADLSGEWEGGCLTGAAYPTNWPTKDGYVVLSPLGPDSAVTAKPLDSVDLHTAVPEEKVTVKITQESCSKLTFDWNGKPKEVALASRTRTTQTESFRRTCFSDAHKWRRTYNFLHQKLKTPLWRNAGRELRLHETLDGVDANYNARFLRTVNMDYSLWEGQLRVNATVYVKASRFDPPAFEFSPPNVGADICLFKRKAR